MDGISTLAVIRRFYKNCGFGTVGDEGRREREPMNGLLILALFCFGMVAYALLAGTLIMRGKFDRAKKPILFWFGMIFYAGAGLVSLVLFLTWP